MNQITDERLFFSIFQGFPSPGADYRFYQVNRLIAQHAGFSHLLQVDFVRFKQAQQSAHFFPAKLFFIL